MSRQSAERELETDLFNSRGNCPAAVSILLGVIYAQQGDIARASLVWRDIVREVPDYQPARANLEVLGSPTPAANGETAADDLPRPAAVNAIMAER